MKIGLISYASNLRALGGGGIHVDELAKALVRKGHTVTIIGAVDQDLRLRDQWNKSDLETLGFEILGGEDIPTALNNGDWGLLARLFTDSAQYLSEVSGGVRFLKVCVPYKDLSHAFQTWLDTNMRELENRAALGIWAEWVGDLLSRGDFDICHAHHWRSAQYRQSSRLDKRLPCVFTPHLLDQSIREWRAQDQDEFMNILRMQSSSEEGFGRKVHQQFPRYTQVLSALESHMEVGGHIIGVSPDEQALLEQWVSGWQDKWRRPKDKDLVHFIPNGVNLDIFVPKPITSPKIPLRLLSIGRLDPIKRFEVAIDVLELLCSHGLTTTLRILGLGKNPNYERVLRSKIESSALTSLVSLDLVDSPISSAEISQYLRQSDFYLQTSEYESFGLTVLEAMATGTPVIAADVGGMGGLVRDIGGGIAIRSDEPAIFAGHIYNLVLNPERFLILARSGVEETRRYAWDVIAEKYIDLYTMCLTDNAR